MADDRDRLLRRGLRLEYVTLGWNVVGIVVTIGAAVAARSVALVGFSLDSGVEIFVSLVVVGQLAGTTSEASQQRGNVGSGTRSSPSPPTSASKRSPR